MSKARVDDHYLYQWIKDSSLLVNDIHTQSSRQTQASKSSSTSSPNLQSMVTMYLLHAKYLDYSVQSDCSGLDSGSSLKLVECEVQLTVLDWTL
uniref:Uncharacterized protein n=1 Tax=Amphimedon queenslandica TaxID=400682 RepID=A0A1X7URJ6_AMPQE